PLSACLISALFVAVQNPLLALWSIALFQLIQLIEGNVIYPRVVGQSVGLPTLFTLAAALIGGNLFGLLGMIFFTPIFAVIYRLIREWVTMRLKKQNEMNLEGE
ncbi:AI-2E family transporter, partial [Streptococcus ruminantium]|nr:AI-2E family transporter [Streptococcus ruminantium]